MNKIEIFKALSNETRLSIIEWLKEPEKNFPPQGGHFDDVVDLKGGVCWKHPRQSRDITVNRISLPRYAAKSGIASFRKARKVDILQTE